MRVVRRQNEDAVGSSGLRASREQGADARSEPHSRDHRHAPVRGLDGRLDDRGAFVGGERVQLAGTARRDERVDAGLGEPGRVATHRFGIELASVAEGRDREREDAPQKRPEGCGIAADSNTRHRA